MRDIINTIISLTIRILIILLTIILIYSVFELTLIVIKSLIIKNEIYNLDNDTLDKNNLFLSTVQGFIAAILVITIIIEVIQSLSEYLKKGNNNYIRIIIEIALIAVIRHLLAVDFEHTDYLLLIGISSVVLVLGIFYISLHKLIISIENIKKEIRQ